MKISESENVRCSIEKVWKYFLDIRNWSKWHGAGIKRVFPRWEKGAVVFWESEGNSWEKVHSIENEKLLKFDFLLNHNQK